MALGYQLWLAIDRRGKERSGCLDHKEQPGILVSPIKRRECKRRHWRLWVLLLRPRCRNPDGLGIAVSSVCLLFTQSILVRPHHKDTMRCRLISTTTTIMVYLRNASILYPYGGAGGYCPRVLRTFPLTSYDNSTTYYLPRPDARFCGLLPGTGPVPRRGLLFTSPVTGSLTASCCWRCRFFFASAAII